MTLDKIAIKGEQSDEERTYTVLDPELVKTLNKPKPKRVVKRTSSKQQVAKKRTHPKKGKTTKCTPIDRNINATQKLLFQQLRDIKLEIKLEPLPERLPAGPQSHKIIKAMKAKNVRKTSATSPCRTMNSPTHDAVDKQIASASTSQMMEQKSPKKVPIKTDQLQHSYSTDTEIDTENESEHNTTRSTQAHHDQSEQSEHSDHVDDDHTMPSSEDSQDQSGKSNPIDKVDPSESPRKESDPDNETDQINANKKQKRLKRKRARIDSNNEDTDAEPPKKTANLESRSTTTSNSDDTEQDTTSGNTKKRRKFKCPQCNVVEY